MSKNLTGIAEALEKKHKESEQIVENMLEYFKLAFKDEKQLEIIGELYTQLYKLSNDVEELNIQNIFMSSFIDAFQHFLVGEGNLITEKDYMEYSEKAFKNSIEQLKQAYKELQESIDNPPEA